MKSQRVSKANFDYEYEQDIRGNLGFGDKANKVPFHKTTKGKSVIAVVVIGFLAVAGVLSGLLYWAGMQS
jgi:hypothetical protein